MPSVVKPSPSPTAPNLILRRRKRCALDDRDGKPIEAPITITRADLEQKIQPLIDRCLDLARRALEQARVNGADLDRILLVGGEPGIGKTRFVEAAIGEASALGFGIALGACDPCAGTPEYWPWRQVHHALIAPEDGEPLPPTAPVMASTGGSSTEPMTAGTAEDAAPAKAPVAAEAPEGAADTGHDPDRPEERRP